MSFIHTPPICIPRCLMHVYINGEEKEKKRRDITTERTDPHLYAHNQVMVIFENFSLTEDK